MEIRSNAPIAVIGAGTMGAGIAQVAATAGHPVTVIDQAEDALERGRATVAAALDQALRKGRLDESARDAIAARITWATDIAATAGHALAIEAIVERLDIKQALVTALAGAMPPDALIASNTSSLGIGDIAAILDRPERFLGLHFFNPVPAMKLVEVIAGPATDPAAVNAAADLMRAWGKRPVIVRDVPGFIVNRVARPYYGEGFAALGEGIDPALIDAALTGGGGFRMGPLALADLIGHDVNFAVASSVYDSYDGKTRFRPQDAQRALRDGGQLGRKSGTGVYDYAQDLPAPPYAAPAAAPASIAIYQLDQLAPLGAEARAAGIAVTDGPAIGADMARIGNSMMALGDGRPLGERPGVDVLIDQCRDFASASVSVISATSPAHAEAAAGLLQAIGRKVLVIPDRPGQIVLRTLAQLANAAADAVTDDVADADGIDDAMIHGANHPEGPLGWARRVGQGRVRAALDNIATASGDAMYQPSSYFGAP
ncbi:3-hydroxyacyl-CoA dehydrogenase [Sphingomonas sp. Root710]|uniref:3-hydroxyacyl-CoA dehydrogenase NAD-binding domain-containing protein n=1 Tax=Sphingomonas sp. Root710 TaxID=1736594 RepID=UPI0006F41386|nr:3-hydroxyacyl-CoA dehydrogenase NAD-binding domain-containing protein [Sphingomonas sp. Root710]KRB79756.1 3-hydroxyacyl-CoA dehydrogenase [Sphingomonas sp. Root710]